jgi:AcrR family transcriptional regulator
MSKKVKEPTAEEGQDRRLSVLKAAAKVFFSKGYEGTTTLDIATEAKVSKRVLYELFGNKQGILEALIESRAQRMQQPVALPIPHDAKTFFETLKSFGRMFLTELFSESNIAMTRLAIADATRSGVVGKELAASGSEPVVASVGKFFQQSADKGCVSFDDAGMATAVFFYVLIGDVRIKLLMGAKIKITKDLVEQRVDFAVRVVQQLNQKR